MVTPCTEFRLEPDVLDALARIVVAVQAHRARPVNRADAVRWLIRLLDPKNNPDDPITAADVRGFPHVYPPAVTEHASESPSAKGCRDRLGP